MDRDEIINDLTRRRPKGPGREKLVYKVEEAYCYKVRRYKNVSIPSVAQYGYTDNELFDLGFKDRDDVDKYIRERDFEGKSNWHLERKKATLTRRVNKVWNRIQEAVNRVCGAGGVGIYSISRGYGASAQVGNLFARNMEEARESAQLFFGYLFPNQSLRVSFTCRGNVSEIYKLNETTSNKIKGQIKQAQKDASEIQERIEKMQATLLTLTTVESQQVAVETVHALDEQAAA